MDKSHADYLQHLMQNFEREMRFGSAKELNLCPVCNVYNKPEEHRCSTPTKKEIV